MNRKILYGYQMRDGKLTIQPQEAEGVRRVFFLYLEGMSQRQIMDMLNADGVAYSVETRYGRTRGSHRRFETPGTWGKKGIQP